MRTAANVLALLRQAETLQRAGNPRAAEAQYAKAHVLLGQMAGDDAVIARGVKEMAQSVHLLGMQRDELRGLLQYALDSFAPHVEGGEAHEWVKAARAAVARAGGASE